MLNRSPFSRRIQFPPHLILMSLLIISLLFINHFIFNFGDFPKSWDIQLRVPIDAFKMWVIGNRTTHPIFILFFDPLSSGIDFLLRGMEDFLLWLPWPVIVVSVFLFAQKLTDLRVAFLAVGSMLFMGLVGLWIESMQTLALMVVSVFISLAIGIPLGILAARYPKFEVVMRPILDAMQTMPAFVYLIPVLLFFGVARVPSVVATIIYAIPPSIRLTCLGIRQVPHETVEAAGAFGSTSRQILYKVQLPLAMPTIMAGVNQTIMMALSIVVIAALIGAGGLGKVVLDALRSLHVGQAMEAGLAIVFMAILLDRLSYALAQTGQSKVTLYWLRFRLMPERARRFTFAQMIEQGLENLYRRGHFLSKDIITTIAKLIFGRFGKEELINWGQQHAYFFTSSLFLIILLGFTFRLNWGSFPTTSQLPIQAPIDQAITWMRDNLYQYQIGNITVGTGPLGAFIIGYFLDPIDNFLQHWLAWPIIILLVAAMALAVSGWRLALFSASITFCIGLLGMWELALITLSQVIVAVTLSLIIALPLGILAAVNDTAEAILRPILDVLQTIPSFVYLVPVIMLFDIGRVPGIMASILYALPPAIRLTSLGIRQANPEAVEAAKAFGSTPFQTLVKVQLPLALPSIMMGINQTIMMVLAMVVVAGMVGGAGLGLAAVDGLARSQTGRGIEAGLAIVIMAIVMDRLMQAWAKKQELTRHLIEK